MTTDPRPQDLAGALVDAGVVEPERRADAVRVLAQHLIAPIPYAPTSQSSPGVVPLRRRMSEVAGYVGGAFVVGAAVLFFSTTWTDLSRGAQVGLLAGIALLLAAAVGVLVGSAGGRSALRDDVNDVRRRLASVLSAGAALSAGFAVGLLADNPGTWTDESRDVLLGAGVALLVAVAGYLVAPSVVGQVATAVAAFTMVPSGLDAVHAEHGWLFGLVVVALGASWVALAERHVWHEVVPGRILGCLLVLIGAQVPAFDDPQWVAYTLTALVAVAAFTGFVVRPSWPFLATGVAAATLAVPEALTDWAEGSLGSAGVLLATGLTLLVAALAGLRLRHEVRG